MIFDKVEIDNEMMCLWWNLEDVGVVNLYGLENIFFKVLFGMVNLVDLVDVVMESFSEGKGLVDWEEVIDFIVVVYII